MATCKDCKNYEDCNENQKIKIEVVLGSLLQNLIIMLNKFAIDTHQKKVVKIVFIMIPTDKTNLVAVVLMA